MSKSAKAKQTATSSTYRDGTELNTLSTLALSLSVKVPLVVFITSLFFSGLIGYVYFAQSKANIIESQQQTLNLVKTLLQSSVNEAISKASNSKTINRDSLKHKDNLLWQADNLSTFISLQPQHISYFYQPSELSNKSTIYNQVDLSGFIKDRLVTQLKGHSVYFYSSIRQQLISMSNVSETIPFDNNYLDTEFYQNGGFLPVNVTMKPQSQSLAFFIKEDRLVTEHRLNEIQYKSMWLGISFAILSLLFAIFLANKIIQPLLKMTRAIRHYEDTGELQALPIGLKDEIGSLANSFNNVINKVNHQAQAQQNAVITARDISQRMEAILNSIGEAVINVNESGKIVLFNRAAEAIFGYKEHEVLGNIFSMLLPFSRQLDSHFIRSVVTDDNYNSNFHHELNGARKDGTSFRMNLVVTKVKTHEGVVFTGLIRDLTEQVTLEADKAKALNDVKEIAWRLDFALTAPGIGVWDYNVNTEIISWDKRIYQIFGYDPDIALSANDIWLKALHPHDVNFVHKKLFESVKEGNDLNITFRIKKPDNAIAYIEAHAKVVKDNYGKVYRIVGTNKDVTEQLNIQEIKQQALDVAKESLKLKSEFLASMSHEIRTPMNGVIGMLGLLNQTDISPQQAHYLSLANSSANSLLTLINDILDFSKIEAGKLDLEYVPFDIHQLFGDLAESMAVKAQDKGLELILDTVELTDNNVIGDPTRLSQILTNLVGNAIKFTEHGEIVITAALHQVENKLQLDCTIEDTGIGITRKQQAKLFDSFTQVDTSTTRKYGGTGLGLAIVKQLCELMNGAIRVESKKLKGSQFHFSIELQLDVKSTNVKPSIDLQGKRLALAVSNPTNLQVITKQLTMWGADVQCISNMAELQQSMEASEKQDVIIIDNYFLTQNNEISSLAISDWQASHTPCILMALMKEMVDKDAYLSQGFKACFPKPTTTKDLVSSLESAFNNTKPALENDNTEQQVQDDNCELERLSKTAKILLVEDNRVNQAVVTGMLSNWQLSVDIANNGVEALDKLKHSEHPYHLILMDCQMPEMDGYETTKVIRSNNITEICHNTFIIAMTANAMKGDKEKCFTAGMDDYISKPVDVNILKEKLLYWLRKAFKNISVNVESDVIEKPVNTRLAAAQAEVITHTKQNELLINEIWDKQSLYKRLQKNEAIIQKLITMFIEDYDEVEKPFEQAVLQLNLKALAGIAHKIKGSSRNLSFINLGNVLGDMELAAKESQLEKIPALYQQFLAHYKLLLPVIQQYIEEDVT